MKVLLFGKNAKDIEEAVKNSGLEITTSSPDVVISYGGDGTLLSSEREYPGIPKLPIRDSQFCNKCSNHEDKKVIKDLLDKKLNLKEYKKLHTNLEDKDFYALNDFVIRNKEPMHSIRFMVHPERAERVEGLLIGDGIVVSTPFGSTGYFKSITGQSFDSGFGLAFNNTTAKIDPQNFGEGETVTFKLVRGNANLSFDNNPDIYIIPEAVELIFKLSSQVAKIYGLESLRCPNCKVTRG